MANLKGFGEFHLCCSADKSRPAMQLASFENGYIYATDGNVLIKSKLIDWKSVKKESVSKSEGKGLHKDKLKKLSNPKVNSIEFLDNYIVSMDKANKVVDILYYDALPTGNKLNVFTDAMGNPKEGDTFKFVNFEAVVPEEFKQGADSLNENLPAFNPELASLVFKCLPDLKGQLNLLGARFLQYRLKNRPIVVLPPKIQGFNDTDHFGLVMPNSSEGQ